MFPIGARYDGHLIVVDTWSPWQYNTAQVRAVTDLMKHLADTPEMRRMVP